MAGTLHSAHCGDGTHVGGNVNHIAGDNAGVSTQNVCCRMGTCWYEFSLGCVHQVEQACT